MTDIFICYRRDDGGHAERLYDWLEDRFGADRVFIDRENIYGGQGWREELVTAIRRARVSLVVIGPHWFSDKNRARLHEPDDVTRNEIRVALECRCNGRGDEVIPVLAGGAVMPSQQGLPSEIATLNISQAHVLEETQYEASVRGLLELLQHGYGLKSGLIPEEEWKSFNKIRAYHDEGLISSAQAEQLKLELARKNLGI